MLTICIIFYSKVYNNIISMKGEVLFLILIKIGQEKAEERSEVKPGEVVNCVKSVNYI